jgi:hypothetical protein
MLCLAVGLGSHACSNFADLDRCFGGTCAPSADAGLPGGPVAVSDTYATDRDTTLTVPPKGVLDNDRGTSALSAVLDTGPRHGVLSLAADGAFSYAPAAGYVGADSFTYRAKDERAVSAAVLVSLTVREPPAQLLVNGSFESDFAGWTPVGNLEIMVAPNTQVTDGTKAVVFNAGQEAPNGSLSQVFATIPGKTYSLTFDAGVFAPAATNTQKLEVTVTGSTQRLFEPIDLKGIASSTLYTPQVFTFVADATETSLRFRDISATSQNVDLLLDNVRVRLAN